VTLDELKKRLSDGGYQVKKEERLGNDTGTQLRLDGGAIVNVFDNGNFNCQGKNRKAVEDTLKGSTTSAGTQVSVPVKSANTKVFVVYGHDSTARVQLEAMLRRWGLEPLILDQLPSEGQTIIEKLESYTDQVGFAVVLATPDDEGHRAGHPDEKVYRARQNVVLELGMLLSKLGRRKVAILLKQQDRTERPSDIQGLIYIPFRDDVKDGGVLLAKEMAAQGYQIDIQKL
jgi:predicted nucleotide-binding protein